MTERRADTCACGGCSNCTGTAPRPAVADPIVFRHGAIKSRMLARIGSTEIDDERPLQALGTRDADDPTIALIDAFAGALHVLAWNAARLSDDGSIRRTEDRDALVDLTRLLGYEPRPAMSATTTLVFKVDEFTGSPPTATVPKGTKVASVPAHDEKPQIFETAVDLDARVEWNALKPMQSKKQPQVSGATTSIVIEGTATVAKLGDLVLVHLEPPSIGAHWLAARIATIARDTGIESGAETGTSRTTITLAPEGTVGPIAAIAGESFTNRVVILGQRAAAFGATAPDHALMPEKEDDADSGLEAIIAAIPSPGGIMEAPFIGASGSSDEWPGLAMSPGGDATAAQVDLDAVYPDAVPGRFVLFSCAKVAPPAQLGRLTGASELSRADFGLSAKITRIALSGVDVSTGGYGTRVRETAIYIETARETLLVEDDDVALPAAPTDTITVQGAVSMPSGRRIVLSGEQWTSTLDSGPTVGEVAILNSSTITGDQTELVFDRPLATSFRSTTLILQGNAVLASHGDMPTREPELIGSGKASTPSPRFPLKRSPLTHVPAADARGYAPAIEVRVGDRLYEERPTLYGLGSEDRAYTVRVGREQVAEVQFAGRLPTGSYNVTALYRTGAGKAGNLASGRLTTVMTPVLGVAQARNPVPAEGGSDPELVDELRTAAPQSIRTLDRVVSLADFEAFARSRAGVGKSLATELHVGMRAVVCLTIATTELAAPAPGSEVVEALRAGLALVSVPGRTVRIEGFTDISADVTVALALDPALRRVDVEAAVRAALGKAFGRASRSFGVSLHRSEVLAVVQGVKGVAAAHLSRFELPNGQVADKGRLPCPAPAIANGVFQKAGLLSIDPTAVQFEEMQA